VFLWSFFFFCDGGGCFRGGVRVGLGLNTGFLGFSGSPPFPNRHGCGGVVGQVSKKVGSVFKILPSGFSTLGPFLLVDFLQTPPFLFSSGSALPFWCFGFFFGNTRVFQAGGVDSHPTGFFFSLGLKIFFRFLKKLWEQPT